MSEKIRVLLSEEEVDRRIQEIENRSTGITRKIGTSDLRPEGRRVLMCELAKRIKVPVSLDFMSVSSYGDETSSSGVVRIVKDLISRWKEKM